MTVAIAICADDFGMSPGIDRAIVVLAAQRRISATSCMTTSPRWPLAAAALRDGNADIDIGLHLTLVDESPLTGRSRLAPAGRLPPITTLIVQSLLGTIPIDEARKEIDGQFLAFRDAFGRPPDHVDGHLHAHVLPGICDLVREAMTRHAPNAWIRTVQEPFRRMHGRGVSVAKSLLIAALDRSTSARGNEGFSGLYDFDSRSDYGTLFERFVAVLGSRPLVIVHPSTDGEEPIAHASAREAEYRFLSSDRFDAVLAHRGLSVTRMSAML